MRKRVFEIIEVAEDNDRLSRIYDISMIIVIILSLVPIATKNNTGIMQIIDLVSAVIFIIDYILRFYTADYKIKKGKASFILYPVTPMAIIDLIAILPTFIPVSGAFRVLKLVRLLRSFRVFRVFKVVRYSKSIAVIIGVFKKQKEALLVVGGFALGYILITALIVIGVEPDTFPTYFDALYWATISLTSVGYGDIYAVSTAGRIITMLSAILGIAIVALPAGIITAGYMDELNKRDESNDN